MTADSKKNSSKPHDREQQLVLEIEKKSAEIERLRGLCQKAQKDLTDFIFIASHDLQEPVRAITMSLEVLEFRKAKKENLTAEDYEKYLKMIQEAATHCHNQIQELLQYSRSGTQSLEMKKFNLEESVKKILHVLEPELQTVRNQISQDGLDVTVLGDRVKIERVLQNILLNAIRYRAVEPLKIHIAACKEDKQIRISVEDNGAGIDPEFLETVFLPFKRLSRSVPGTGMGLAICRKIVDRHGGKIWAESSAGKGSRFHFTLPLKPGAGGDKKV